MREFDLEQPEEAVEAREELRALDDATYEPESQIEIGMDFEKAEAIELEFVRLIEGLSLDESDVLGYRKSVDGNLTKGELVTHELGPERITKKNVIQVDKDLDPEEHTEKFIDQLKPVQNETNHLSYDHYNRVIETKTENYKLPEEDGHEGYVSNAIDPNPDPSDRGADFKPVENAPYHSSFDDKGEVLETKVVNFKHSDGVLVDPTDETSIAIDPDAEPPDRGADFQPVEPADDDNENNYFIPPEEGSRVYEAGKKTDVSYDDDETGRSSGPSAEEISLSQPDTDGSNYNFMGNPSYTKTKNYIFEEDTRDYSDDSVSIDVDEPPKPDGLVEPIGSDQESDVVSGDLRPADDDEDDEDE